MAGCIGYPTDESAPEVVVLDASLVAGGLIDLRSRVQDVVLSGVRTIIVDVSQLDCLSSAMLTALLWAQRRCRARGGTVLLRAPSRRSLDMLQRTGLWNVLAIEGPGGPDTIGRTT
jgi:anti-sigma B factor antagonist